MKIQNELILTYLKTGFTLNVIEAFEMFSCVHLGSVILDLKNKGYKIKSELITVGKNKQVAQYSMEKE